jgi:outer membrane protein assembly factor BamE
MRVERQCLGWMVAVLLGLLGLGGCRQAPELPTVLSPYKIDIQQGNIITQEMLAKLKAGMTRSQVRFVLGSPLVVDPFRGDRWDYVSLYQKQGKEVERRRVTVIFDDDKLIRIEGDVTLSDSSLAPEPAPPKPVAAEKPPAKPVADTAKPVAAGKPVETQVPAATPPVAKPVAVTPPAAAKPADGAAAAAAGAAPVPAEPPAAPAKAEAATDARAGAAQKPAEDKKADAAKKEAPKEKPKPGFFGRMLDKLGI